MIKIESAYLRPEHARDYGFISNEELKAFCGKKVAIAGVGGDGFQLGLNLAMAGISNFSIADPENFEIENSNRVIGATSSNLGRNKAEVFRDMVMDMRPDAKVEIFYEGVNESNIEEFMHGSHLVLDETELTHLELGTMVAREARKNKIPDLFVMNIGYAALASSFHPEHGKTFEDIMGIPKGAPLDEVRDMKVDFSRCLPYLPKYGDISTLVAVQEGASLPSIIQGVDVAAAIGSTEAFLHLTAEVKNHRRSPTWAPKFRYMDAYSGEAGIIRNSRLSHYAGLLTVLGRCGLGLNPSASYRKEEREVRNQF